MRGWRVFVALGVACCSTACLSACRGKKSELTGAGVGSPSASADLADASRQITSAAEGAHPTPSLVASVSDPVEAGAHEADPIKVGIKQIDETHFEVKREVLDDLANDQKKWMSSARLVPAIADGKPAGMRIFGVRQGTTFDHFGLKNGDTLQSINGEPLTGPADATRAYSKLKAKDAYKLIISRQGATLEFNYRVTK